jgi:hypothetical protein
MLSLAVLNDILETFPIVSLEWLEPLLNVLEGTSGNVRAIRCEIVYFAQLEGIELEYRHLAGFSLSVASYLEGREYDSTIYDYNQTRLS